MRFDLDDSIFTSNSAMSLIKLFDLGNHLQQRIVLINENNGGAAQQWIAGQSAQFADEIHTVLADSQVLEAIQPSSLIWHVNQFQRSPRQISVSQALELMRMPLEIHVENKQNDSAFLFSVMKSEQRDYLKMCLDDNSLVFIHGGGDTLLTNLEALPSDPVINSKRLALYDSDALLPAKPSKKSQNLLITCNSKFIASHCLNKRAAENYLTKHQLHEWVKIDGHNPPRKAKVDTFYASMNEEQRSHFRMREGWQADLTHDDYRANEAEVKTFYQSAALHPKWYLMKDGFKRSIRDMFAAKPAKDSEIIASSWAGEFTHFIELVMSRL